MELRRTPVLQSYWRDFFREELVNVEYEDGPCYNLEDNADVLCQGALRSIGSCP